LSFSDAQERAKYLRKYSRRKNAPPDLKKMVLKIRKKESNQKKAFRSLRAYRKKHERVIAKLHKLQATYYRRQDASDNLSYILGIRHFDNVVAPTVISSTRLHGDGP
jgi:hypothetical protein